MGPGLDGEADEDISEVENATIAGVTSQVTTNGSTTAVEFYLFKMLSFLLLLMIVIVMEFSNGILTYHNKDYSIKFEYPST